MDLADLPQKREHPTINFWLSMVRMMIRPAVSLLSAIGLLCSASAAFSGGPVGTIHVGPWHGGAYTNDSSGSFDHCAAGADYASGVALILSQTATRSWIIGFANKSWTLTKGTPFPIELVFDGQTQFRIFGVAVNPALISAPLPEPALNQLRRSHLMVATGNTNTFQFNLASADVVVPTIANCVEKIKAEGLAGAGDFSAQLPANPPAEAAAAKSEAGGLAAPAMKLANINGTGFVISESGHVLTNNHVVSQCVGDIEGNLTGQPSEKLRVVSNDQMNDLALLQVTGTFRKVARLRATPIHSGDSVIAIGYPFHGLLTSDFTVTTGIVSSLSGILNDTRFLQISAPVQPGNSGGPLFDTSGNIVGVVTSKLNVAMFAKITGNIPENINFAIKTGAVRDFLDNSAVPYESAQSQSELKTAQVADNARAYTMLISCSARIGTTAAK